MKKEIKSTDSTRGMDLKNGRLHSECDKNNQCGIPAVVNETGQEIEIEQGEVIINRKSVNSNKELIVKGTPKEILSTINQLDNNGVAIGDEEAEIIDIYKLGGSVGELYDDKGNKTRKHTSLLIWGHNPQKDKFVEGGSIPEVKILGFSEDWTTCDRCGRDELKGTYTALVDDVEYHLGTSCIAKIMDLTTSQAKTFISKEEKQREEELKDEIKSVNKELEIKAKDFRDNWDSDDFILENPYYKSILKEIANNKQDIYRKHGYDKFGMKKFAGGGSIDGSKSFIKWFIEWYKTISSDMNISFSAPNELQPYKENNVLILDVFEKKNQSIDAKKYLKEIIDKADEFDITIYLEPSPKHTFFIDNEEKKSKITKEYLITYYKNFGFIENNDNYSMKRTPKTFKTGGKIPNFSNMSKSEIKEFYDSPEGKKLDAETYAEWSKLVNMSKSELEDFYNSEEGKQAGLKQKEADEQGIDSGRESARWIIKMKDIPYTEWSSDMWRWAKKQISFIKRMTGVNGSLRDENGKPTRKLLALKIWGNNPEKFEIGGELKNINYMNTVGKQLSLIDDDTNEDYQTIDIFQGTEIETFAKGGGIGENQASFSIREVNNWDEVPVRWKNTPKINKINYKVDPKDKGLNDLMSKIVGNDELRPLFSGINFDENGATSTDAHRLLSIPAETEFRGVYKTLKSIQKTKGTDLIDGKYPNYQAVIPKEFSAVHQVDLYKLLQYCKVALNYVNKTTYQIGFKVNEEMNIGLNAKFTIDILTSFIKMGYDKAYFHFSEPSRAVVISNDKNPTLGKSIVGLIMPVMLNRGGDKYSVLGSMDIDYNLYLKPYFDFEKNEILNSDGSVADFKMNYGEDDVFTKEIVGIIKSITPSNSKLYILENFIVKNKTIKVTDLADSIEIKNIDVPDGIYRIENDAVIQSSLSIDDIDDYPKIAIIEDYDTIKINKDFFKWAIEKTKNYVGKDDLRPVMTGINIQKKGDLLSITSTDAHLLATIDSAKYIKLNGIENDFSITVTPKNLFEAVKLMDSEEIEIAFSKDRYSDGALKGSMTVKFICSDVVYTTGSIEGKYPNYRAVIPYNNPKALLINMRDINSIVNSTEAKEFVSKNKKEADLIKIYGVELDGNINISIQSTKGGYKQETKVLGDKFLGKVGYDYDYETTNGNTCSLIMPVMKNEGLEGNVFTFNAVLFGKFLDNLDGDILELGFSEPSRAYIVGERNLFYTEPKIKIKPKTDKVKSQIEKGLKVEQEHRETLEEIASGDITVDEAIEKTVEDHLEEDENYYDKLEVVEGVKKDTSIKDLIEALEILGETELIEALMLLDDDVKDIENIEVSKGYFEVDSNNTSFENIKKINDYFNKWTKINSEKDHEAFKKINIPMFGTYLQNDILKMIDNYEIAGIKVLPNRVITTQFLKEVGKIIKSKINNKETFATGGEVENIELDFYIVRFDTDDDSNIALITTDYDKAKSEYNNAFIGDFGDGSFTVSIEKRTDKFNFVYELDEDETIEDYPIESHYDESFYYELVEEGENETLEYRTVEAVNESSEDLLEKVQEWAKNKFGNYKYNTIDVYPNDNEDEDYIGTIQLRIADHSQNENNLPYGIDRSLSVVIANKDATRGRFQQNRPQIYFDGDADFDEVIEEIEDNIDEAKEYIQSKQFAKGGEVENKSMIFEPTKTQDEIDEEIMETQFGKNI